MRFEPRAGRDNERELGYAPEEARDEAWWRRVYLAVIICTALVILSLWAFSRAFSS